MSAPANLNPACIALLTDFGNGEYAGIMRGVLAGLAPSATVIDLSHQVAPQAVLSAAYVLFSAWDYFPRGTVFCAVVDPGVGSRRGLLFAESGGRSLVAPDNGIVSLLARFKADLRCSRLRPPPEPGVPSGISATFHGRDIFAPAAALAARGASNRLRGEAIEPILDAQALPEASRSPGRKTGRILHIDRFGNCVSALHRLDLKECGDPQQISVSAGPFRTSGLKSHYAQVENGQALAYLGSAGFLEIAVREGHAARLLKLDLGDKVVAAATGSGEEAKTGIRLS
jgi:S-adenosylmethionine hydrolase